MSGHENLVSALACALERDPSGEALRRAIAALVVSYAVSPSRAYAMLVRASARHHTHRGATAPLVPGQRAPASTS